MQGEVELGSGRCKAQPSLILIKAVSFEDGNYETVTTRMKPSVIVWDLETVPDLGGFAAAHDLVGKSDVEVREAIGDKFPKHIYHSIRCCDHFSCFAEVTCLGLARTAQSSGP